MIVRAAVDEPGHVRHVRFERTDKCSVMPNGAVSALPDFRDRAAMSAPWCRSVMSSTRRTMTSTLNVSPLEFGLAC